MKYSIILTSLFVGIILTIVPSTFAVEDERTELKNEIKVTAEENSGLIKTVQNKVATLRAITKTGILQTISGNSLTIVTKDNKTYTINIVSTTRLLRNFGGKSDVKEFSVGDELNVVGKFTDETQTTIEARVIRNKSIQIRHGAFFGTVTAKNSDNFVIESKERGNQTVYYTGAKFVMRNEATMTVNDLQVGDRVRVKGLWNKKLNKITEVKEVKDFTLPKKAEGTPKAPKVSTTAPPLKTQ
jgi:hypothetical protein